MAATLERSVLAGEPLADAFIVSCHSHIGVGWNHPTNGSDAASLIGTMDRVGIDVSCISSMRAIGPDMLGGNAEIAAAAAQSPTRLIGVVVANPHTPVATMTELQTHFTTGDFGMIKVHPEFHAHPMNGPGYDEVYRFAAEHRIPVLTHSWGFGRGLDHPRLAASIAERFPELPFILGHSGGTSDGLRASVEMASRFPSIYLDTGTSLVLRGSIELLVGSVGAERVLFGTDAVYLADAPQVARVAGSRIAEHAKRLILGENLAGLLRNTTVGLRNDWDPTR